MKVRGRLAVVYEVAVVAELVVVAVVDRVVAVDEGGVALHIGTLETTLYVSQHVEP